MTIHENTRFAENEFGEIIEAEKGMNNNQSFICLGCGETVGAYAVHTKGERSQATHFRHTGNTGVKGGCGNYESYIHNFSKRKFAENYMNISLFELRQALRIKCNQSKYSECTDLFNDVINLKERYPYIKIESRDGTFIPDCLIYNDYGDKIYIEIKFKSPVSEEKRNSGIPIIEIEVSSEKDIQEIIHCGFIGMSMKPISLINFENVVPNSVYDCGGICPQDAIIEERKKVEQERKERLEKQKTEKEKAEKEHKERLEKQKKEREKEEARRLNIEQQAIQDKPKIVGTKTIQLFRPKKCFNCETHPIHYMNVGRVVVDDKYNFAFIEEELFKDEITSTTEFSIAKRKDIGDRNAYYCPICGSWIANNRLLAGSTCVYEDEKILEC